MTHLVKQDQDCEADAELHAVQGPVEGHERGQTEQELQLEEREQVFAVDEQDGHGCQRAELPDPGTPGIGRRGVGNGRGQPLDTPADPLGLRRRQEARDGLLGYGRPNRAKRTESFPS